MALDALDKRIIALLRDDPQISNKQISKETHSAEATIAARLNSLLDENAIRIVAQRDIEAFGMPLVAHVDIFVRDNTASSVATELAGIVCIASVVVLAGSPQIIAQVHAKGLADLKKILSTEIGAIEGIEKIETHISLQILRYRTDLANLKGEQVS